MRVSVEDRVTDVSSPDESLVVLGPMGRSNLSNNVPAASEIIRAS